VPFPSIADIQNAACEVFGVARAEMIGVSRQARIAHVRAVAVQLCRQLTKSSYPRIGRAFHRHHATIIALERRGHDLIDAFPDYTAKRQAVLRRLGFD
jgi:chromosomal replication initiator protein